MAVPFRFILRLLTVFALLLAPAGMMGSHAAMAAPPTLGSTASASHCAEMGGSQQRAPEHAPAKNIDCMIACSCMPPLGAELRTPPLLSAAPGPAATPARMHGLTPQAEPPPPRLS